MKDFIKGLGFCTVMLCAFLLGAVAIMESHKLEAANGFLVIGAKLYKATPMFTEKPQPNAEPVFCCPQVKE